MISYPAFMDELEKISSDLIPGGLSQGMKPSDFDKKELKEGVEDESKEHTPIKPIAKEIAMDHLAKDPHYYSHMKKMEKKASVHDSIKKCASMVKYTKPKRM